MEQTHKNKYFEVFDSTYDLDQDKKEQVSYFLSEYNMLSKQNLEYFYILPFIWIKNWDDFICGFSSESPGIIDCSGLLDKDLSIKSNLVENIDFIIVTKTLAFYFFDKYSVNKKLKTKFRHLHFACNGEKSKS